MTGTSTVRRGAGGTRFIAGFEANRGRSVVVGGGGATTGGVGATGRASRSEALAGATGGATRGFAAPGAFTGFRAVGGTAFLATVVAATVFFVTLAFGAGRVRVTAARVTFGADFGFALAEVDAGRGLVTFRGAAAFFAVRLGAATFFAAARVAPARAAF